MLFLNVDLLFKNCLTDRLIQISIFFAILFTKLLQTGRNDFSKITCMCACTQENRAFFASKSKCIVYWKKKLLAGFSSAYFVSFKL